MNDIKILIATHKEYSFPTNDIFLPIQVGCKLANKKLNIQGDDTGDNISEKNPNYAELTALYWAWKNLNADIIGLCHYRRYFYFQNYSKNTIYFSLNKLINQYIPTEDKIIKLLDKYDIILPKPYIYPYSLELHYKINHISEDFNILSEIIKTKYQKYYSSWINTMKYNNKIYQYNMFICKAEIFRDYCNWLFSILSDAEKKIQLSPYYYQHRVFGFLGERLLTTYCLHNNFNSKEFPVIYLTEEFAKFPQKFYWIKSQVKNLCFLINTPKAIYRH
jgi:hypothetical protein